ncbi:MAG: hypothetical protein KHW91_15720 [Clostridiales bacterium]|nr:hypothetical protein [Clostridiales bacterium]
MTTQEMLAQHKKLMDEAQRLEPSVMVTERNWSALLEMQDRLFRQQMQLNADLKTLLTKQEAQNALTEMQESAEKFERQRPDHNPERYEESAFGYGADGTEEDHHLRVDLDCGSDLVHGAVQFCRAVEQMTDDAPVRDAATMPTHIDSKRRKKLWQKKTALGHAEDDHEEMRMDTM